jgi:hypothetical protein
MKDVVLLLKCIALVCVCGVIWNVCAGMRRWNMYHVYVFPLNWSINERHFAAGILNVCEWINECVWMDQWMCVNGSMNELININMKH